MKPLNKIDVAVVGAGLSGAVIAFELANAGFHVDIFEYRDHIAGNCYTKRDIDTGIMVHVYGPHIFHTNDKEVWDYINQFDEMVPYVNRVKAIANGKVFSLPINLLTINQFYGKCLSPSEAERFIKSIGDSTIEEPMNFEQQALKFIGKDLYDAFFKGYTLKQWGVHPSKLPASILKRLPVRFNFDDNYYNSKFQGIPKHGYTHIIEKLIDHNNITLHLNHKFNSNHSSSYNHVFYCGSIDEWFDFCEGQLEYRTLDFHSEVHDKDFQGNPVINYCDIGVPFTRITEHKHFAYWENHENTIVYKEYSRKKEDCDIPYYPLPFNNGTLLDKYKLIASEQKDVTFIGRLGTYRYIDMDIALKEAKNSATKFISRYY